jgi:hypothetical protein
MRVKRPTLATIRRAALASPDCDESNLADDLVDDVDDDTDTDAIEQRFDVYYWTMNRIREFRGTKGVD